MTMHVPVLPCSDNLGKPHRLHGFTKLLPTALRSSHEVRYCAEYQYRLYRYWYFGIIGPSTSCSMSCLRR